VKVRIEDFNFGRIDGSWWTSSPKAVTYARYRYRPWVKLTVDAWVNAANSQNGTLFHAIGKTGKVWGTGFTPKVIWSIVREAASTCGSGAVAPHDLRRTCARLCHQAGGELEQIQFLLGHVSVQTTERYLGCKQRLRDGVNDGIGLEPDPP
jgi:site-specific recombinase XerD